MPNIGSSSQQEAPTGYSGVEQATASKDYCADSHNIQNSVNSGNYGSGWGYICSPPCVTKRYEIRKNPNKVGIEKEIREEVLKKWQIEWDKEVTGR
ncbi:hypothetical protein FWK35_00011147 [Aphis craccivora]|uniref:Uncharacterized protein n=1 Tax=Aphis craccivora TaxID=307492 RepID=A0A6G0Z9G5_APHCR|nr:hypothetical protein FWK35_00011147 [Aphis craccivora]